MDRLWNSWCRRSAGRNRLGKCRFGGRSEALPRRQFESRKTFAFSRLGGKLIRSAHIVRRRDGCDVTGLRRARNSGQTGGVRMAVNRPLSGHPRYRAGCPGRPVAGGAHNSSTFNPVGSGMGQAGLPARRVGGSSYACRPARSMASAQYRGDRCSRRAGAGLRRKCQPPATPQRRGLRGFGWGFSAGAQNSCRLAIWWTALGR